MAMGRRKKESQDALWVETGELARSPGHPFYERLDRILDTAGFDEFVERLWAQFYAERMGRPSLPPAVYFRLLLIGYFEGIDSERGIAWRVADSLTLREFLGLELSDAPPDHSTISRNRRLIDLESHQEVFAWVLRVLAKRGLLRGKTLGVDTTTLEANAALRSIVRRDSGESYEEFLVRLAKASGIDTPTRQDLAKIDKNRPGKGSNDDWQHPQDPDAKITKMKDGRTHLAHKAEHAVDMETGAVVGVRVDSAIAGDTQTVEDLLEEVVDNLGEVMADPEAAEQLSEELTAELVADKGYHSNAVLRNFRELGIRTYISEPKRGRRNWKGKPAERDATYANRRRMSRAKGQGLQRRRGELIERGFAHCYDSGGMRRTYLRHHPNILKRVLIHVAGFNLGLVMRQATGVGTPRGLQGRLAAALAASRRFLAAWRARCRLLMHQLRLSRWILPAQPKLVPCRSTFVPSRRSKARRWPSTSQAHGPGPPPDQRSTLAHILKQARLSADELRRLLSG
jgi:transposase